MANREPEDEHIWKIVRKLHDNGWTELVTRRRPYVPEWVDRLWGRRRGSRTDGDYGFRLNFAEIHRMYMRRLQAQLVDMAISVQFDNGELKNSGAAGKLGDMLKKYVQAVQDHEYMAKYAHKSDDPFLVSCERQHDRFILMRAMNLKGISASDLADRKAAAIPTGPWEENDRDAQPLASTRTETLRRALWLRVGAAFLGVIFLVGPMWLLVLKREVYFQLGFTTGCVSVFALMMAWIAPTADVVFSASLAYAAVLMVFIGVMMQEQGTLPET